jgi:hypothetical protein
MSDKRLRSKIIMVRVSPAEHEEIGKKALFCGKKVPSYMRSLAHDYPIQSKVDQLALSELIKIRADLGRLGGLLKIWLTNNDKNKTNASLGGRSYFSIDHLVDELEKKQNEILEIARKVMR